MHKAMFRTGIIGAIITALCCVTPLLPWVLGGVGLSGLLNVLYRDAVLFPLLFLFIGMAGYAYLRIKRSKMV